MKKILAVLLVLMISTATVFAGEGINLVYVGNGETMGVQPIENIDPEENQIEFAELVEEYMPEGHDENLDWGYEINGNNIIIRINEENADEPEVIAERDAYLKKHGYTLCEDGLKRLIMEDEKCSK